MRLIPTRLVAKIVEAMACGCPVVASDIAAHRELLLRALENFTAAAESPSAECAAPSAPLSDDLARAAPQRAEEEAGSAALTAALLASSMTLVDPDSATQIWHAVRAMRALRRRRAVRSAAARALEQGAAAFEGWGVLAGALAVELFVAAPAAKATEGAAG